MKIKARQLLFFLVGQSFYMLEDSLMSTVKYTETGLNTTFKIFALKQLLILFVYHK